ncbi:flagellar filament capping protein FliD [Shewanella colwelliana]|uniref:Flagellar hook-associated protein 2 n=1 Tax=Shewanella colwelliana TaxID=23 RepID=A0A1E5IVP2_SHECO|nr:flagellar filament capping protein FliD [Shewanella colwelliana]MCZ4336764.1 flagellar filament capping protein FliD [Shewanella colwelliana]OEG74584.1 flagellar hook protein FliD [Shewanella colwelliana]
MALTATGIGSGLDINTIVGVLVDAEKVPKEAIFNKTEDTIDAKVSAIGSLKSALSTFQDALDKLKDGDALNQRSVSTGDSNYFTASADKNAQTGSYNISVEQLAQRHKVAGAFTADVSAPVGEGSLGFTVNGETFSVGVEPGDSLSAIADKINNADDNVGVTATIVTTDGGSRLVISSDTEGPASNVSVTASDTVGTGLNDMFGVGNLSEVQAAKESIIYIDGQKLQSETNEIKNAISGVTLNLTDADLNKTSVLKIELDEEAVKENVQGFVDAYNSLVGTIESISSYDSEKKKASALQGDSMIRSIESQLRNMISTRVDDGGGSVALYDIGIEADRYGKLSVNSTKLDKAISEDMGSIENLFATDTTGLATRLDTLVEGYVKSGGLIDSRNNAYTNDKQRLEDQREAFSLKMEQLQARLFKQFNAMDLVVGKLNQQASGIVNGLNSLPGVIKQQG